jgi:DNA-binding response OmpR family regulator
MRILFVEDDREVADYVSRGLEEENNSVTVSFDGVSALQTAQSSSFDIIVLDVMLPFLDGFEVTRRLRARSVTTPILLLTARDTPQDVVRGLDAGADDYLTKPFSFEVLLARLRARTRVGTAGAGLRLRFSDLAIDLETHEAWRGKKLLTLTRTEFSILECLMRAAGRVAPRQRLIESVWGPDREVGNNNLDVFMRFLRTKVDLPGRRRLIQTVRGVGYRLRESEE